MPVVKNSGYFFCDTYIFFAKSVANFGKMYYNKNVIQSKERYAKEHLTYG